jgi:hypothetical protein
VSARTLGAVLAALGVSMTIFPFLPWYAADVPGRRITATGIEAAGEAWSVPILGLVVVVAGVAVAVQAVPSVAGARWVGLTAAAAGALAVAMVARLVVDLPVAFMPDVRPAPAIPVLREPALFAAAAAAAAAVAVALGYVRTAVGG